MAEQMLPAARLALRLTTTAFDSEILALLNAAILDLGVAGIVVQSSALVQTACITYAKMHFGEPDEYDRLKKSYDEQKAQLISCTGYGLE